MVDQNTIFGGMLTNLGAAKKTNCDALGIPWEPRYMLIGDANGTDPVPSPAQTQLVHQVYRAQLNQLYVSPADDKVLVAELVLPPDVGGWWVRELGLEDKDGVFSAVANVAPSYKPQLAQNSGRNQVVRMHIITNDTANIQLKIDPSVVLATREYVDNKVKEELNKQDFKHSVLAATTTEIPLNGIRSIDGVAAPAGSRVLVKNQTSAKDNGIYVTSPGAWTRATDADASAEVTPGLCVPVENGLTQADTNWQLVSDGAITLGVTPLTFQNITYGLAPLLSPKFLGIPTAPTPPSATRSEQVATTEFVYQVATPSAPTPQTPSFIQGFVDFNGGSSILKYDGNVFVTIDATAAKIPSSVTTMSVLGTQYRPNKDITGVGFWTQGTVNKGFFAWRLGSSGGLFFEFASGTASGTEDVRFCFNIAFNKP